MKSWKTWLLLVLGGVLCIISASCALPTNPLPKAQLRISTQSLAAGTQNVDYSAPLDATGGTSPYTWSLLSGALPAGLTLSSGGTIAGTPTVAGSFTFTVGVADSAPTPATASVQLGLTIAGKVTIMTTFLPAGPVNAAYSATLSAVGGVTPYTWTLASGSLPAGLTLSSAGAISGTPTTAGSSTFTVQVADSESTPSTDTAQLSITINNTGDTEILKGNYAFVAGGFDPVAGQWTVAGSFVSDGNGNITSGVVDFNAVNTAPVNTAVTGTYTVPATGLGILTLTSEQYTVTLAFALFEDGNGRIIEYDDTTGSGSRGAGVLRKQDTSAFSLDIFAGTYVYGMTGAGSSGERMVNVGELTVTTGDITNGLCDINDGGVFSTCTFTGTVSAVDPQTGRALVQNQGNNGPSNLAMYVVSANEAVLEQIDSVPVPSNPLPVQIDSVPGTSNPLLAGSMFEQTGLSGARAQGTHRLSNGGTLDGNADSMLDGTTVLYYQDIHSPDGADQSGAMILSFDGNGNFSTIAADEDLAGVITQKTALPDVYTVADNGAVSLGEAFGAAGQGGAMEGFVISQSRALLVGTGANSIYAVVEPQEGGPFTDATIEGPYAGGTLEPLDYVNSRNEVDMASADAAGILTIDNDSSSQTGLGQQMGEIVNYTIDANGRGTTADTPPVVFYVISPDKIVILQPQMGADVNVLEQPPLRK